MKLKNFPGMIQELKNLAAIPNIGIDSKVVQESAFYKAMQYETELDASYINNVSPKLMLLIAKIASNFSTLRTIDLRENFLGEHAIAIATELAKISTLTSINLHDNDLGKYGPATVSNLEKLTKLESIDLSNNDLGKYGPATASKLIKMPSLKSLLLIFPTFSGDLYNLEKDAITEILEDHNSLVKAHNKSLYMGAFAFSNCMEDTGLPMLPNDITNLIMGVGYENHIEFEL